jgi:hypothetical protein
MSTFEEVNAAALAYQATLTLLSTLEPAANAAQQAFEAAVAAEQATVDAAIANQPIRIAQEQAILDAAFETRNAAEVAMYAALQTLAETVSAYVPPEP